MNVFVKRTILSACLSSLILDTSDLASAYFRVHWAEFMSSSYHYYYYFYN